VFRACGSRGVGDAFDRGEGADVVDRRQFLAAASGTMVSVFVAASLRQAALATAPAATDITTRLNALFDVFMDERLAKDPELVTALGLDKGKYAGAKSRLTENSLERVRDFKQENASQLKRLKAFGRGQLSAADLASYDTVEFQMETIARTDPFDYGDLGRPYIVSQLTGAYQSVPTFLDRQHHIANKDDADAYLARLRAFAVVLDQETERLQHDAGLKVVPPDFLIDRTLQQMHTLRSAAPADSILSTSVARRTTQLGIAGSYGEDAAHIVAGEVYPALDRQSTALAKLRPDAVHEASVSRLPQGAAFYQVALRSSTTTDMSPEEVHQLGLDQGKALSAQMDALLHGEGKTTGTVAERAQALAKDPDYLFPNTDAGRQQILDYCNGLIKALQPHLPQYFRILPKTPVEIRRVPAYIEAGAPGGYYQRPALDGSRPGAFYINLRDTNEWSRWKLPTSCTTSPSRGITSSWRWCWRCPRSRSSARQAAASPPTLRAGLCMPSSCAMRWGCMPKTRSGGWGCCSRHCSAQRVVWSTRGCTTRAGAASARSITWWRLRARIAAA
jgi:uncharacterized protein (DUF885 family)